MEQYIKSIQNTPYVWWREGDKVGKINTLLKRKGHCLGEYWPKASFIKAKVFLKKQ